MPEGYLHLTCETTLPDLCALAKAAHSQSPTSPDDWRRSIDDQPRACS